MPTGCEFTLLGVWLCWLALRAFLSGDVVEIALLGFVLVAGVSIALVMRRRVLRTDEASAPPPAEPKPAAAPENPVRARALEALYSAHTCPVCHKGFEVGSDFHQCLICREWYHESCWNRSAGCVTQGCPNAREGTVWSPHGPAHNIGICPFCQSPILQGADSVRCPQCGVPYHSECWQANGGCAVYGCGARFDV